MNTNDMIKEIHEKVNDMHTKQEVQHERINNMQTTIEEHDNDIENLKSDNAKFKGAGIFIGIVGTIASIWKGIFT